MSRLILLAVVLLAAACAESPARPSPPPPPTPPAPAEPSITRISGRVVATVTEEALPNVAIDMGGLTTATDGRGSFSVEWATGAQRYFPQVILTAPNILRREFTLSALESRELTVDAIPLDHGFDLDFYRRLIRDAAERPDGLRALRRWTQAPRLYLKTVDEQGVPVDEETLRLTEMALDDDAAAWTGGRFGLAEIVRGTETREGQTEWITVKWPNPFTPGLCGRAQIAAPGGWIELNHLNPLCGCGASRISAGVVRHELGHALGFFHANEAGSLMSAQIEFSLWCDGHASARERYHAAIAYSRKVGNTDPDTDPLGAVHQQPLEPIVIVD